MAMNVAAGWMKRSIVAAGAIVMLVSVADAQWLNYPTPGYAALPDGKPNLAAPAPRAADGRPDLSGIWAAECAIYGKDSCFTRVSSSISPRI